jgi:2-polyprenyl-3-methyl-5-hydroxy-6-metoxy-1,4-benzoquinol methylase
MKQRLCEVCGSGNFKRLFEKEKHGFFRCRSCQLIRIDPPPTDEVLGGIYGAKYYDAWGVQTGADRVRQLKMLTFRTHVFNKANFAPGSRVLDCGAAFGALMEVVKERGGEPYGIELAAEAAAEIGHRFGSDRVFSGPFEQASFPGLGDGAFDVVFMCDFIEHVRDPLAVLRKASKLLKRAGRIVITTPDGGSASNRLMGAGWPHYKIEHLYYFNRHNLPLLLKQAGVSTTSAGSAWKVLNLQYIQHQFNTYPRAVITPLINLLARCVGARLRQRPISVRLGEMIIAGTKD